MTSRCSNGCLRADRRANVSGVSKVGRPVVVREPEGLDCPECGAKMLLKPSRFGLFWGCENYPSCKTTHGAHPDGTPLGIPADKKTRDARMAAHAAFDELWRSGLMTRSAAYRWLRQSMRLSAKEAHIARFSQSQCKRVVQLVGRLKGKVKERETA